MFTLNTKLIVLSTLWLIGILRQRAKLYSVINANSETNHALSVMEDKSELYYCQSFTMQQSLTKRKMLSYLFNNQTQ